MKHTTVSAALSALSGIDARLIGDAHRTFTHPAPIDAATSADAITFCSATGDAGAKLVGATRSGVVVCGPDEVLAAARGDRTLIVTPSPRLAFIRLVERFFKTPPVRGVHSTAFVHATARVAASAYIGPFAVVEAECEIGEDSVIHGHVHLYGHTRVGKRVTIHAGSVLGADGFGYARNERSELEKFPHIGGVVIEDDVEIGANTCVDRGTLGDTIVRQGAKIDNLVHIAHNVIVGRHAAVIALSLIGGSTTVGNHAWIAPGATVRDTVRVGANATVGMGAVVTKDVPDGAVVAGSPARPIAEHKRMMSELQKLARAEEGP